MQLSQISLLIVHVETLKKQACEELHVRILNFCSSTISQSCKVIILYSYKRERAELRTHELYYNYCQ